ncbi:glycosyltransferase [Candidatus Woesearchaeota archaeon]|nr:glycosyltransferase [Candidatus Woesearchaeota archaeon]
MNVAIVGDCVTPLMTGASRSTLRFAELLSKRGHKIIIIAARYPGMKNVDLLNGVKTYRFRSVAVPKYGKSLRIFFPTVSELKDILLKEKIHLLHVMVPTPATLMAVMAAKSLGIKIVAHSHTQSQNVLYGIPGFSDSKTLNHILNKYLAWFYKQANIVICPSKFGEALLKKYNQRLKTVVVSNGVDTSKFKKASPRAFLDKYGLSKRAKRILFVGRLHPEKSIETLIRSMPYVLRRLTDVQLDIVSSGYLLKPLKRSSKKLGLEKHVRFFGNIPDKELVMAYNACDVFVLPSLAELEGMVVLEAMSCGKPVIIADSKDSAAADLVEGNGLLFKPEDYKDLSGKILALLQNERMRRKMADVGYRKSKEYDVTKSVKSLEKIYASL